MSETQPINSKQIGIIYDEQAAEYAAFADSSYSWKYLESVAFDKYLQDLYKPDTRVLDLGCGTGRVVSHLVSRGIMPQNITGIDTSDRMIQIASSAIPEATFIHTPIEEIGFPAGSFDLVTSNMVFHYLDNDSLTEVLDKIWEVLTPDGVLFFVDSDPDQTAERRNPERVNKWLVEKTPWGKDVPYFNRDPHKLLLDLMYYAGFDLHSGWQQKVADEGKVNMEKYDYYSQNSRIAARFFKVSPEEKARRLRDKGTEIPTLSTP